jgi:hypothetical protein
LQKAAMRALHFLRIVPEGPYSAPGDPGTLAHLAPDQDRQENWQALAQALATLHSYPPSLH